MSVRTSFSAILLFILILCPVLIELPAQNVAPGITTEFPAETYCIGSDPAQIINRPVNQNPAPPKGPSLLPQIQAAQEWSSIDSLNNTVRLPMGERYALALHCEDGQIEEILPPCDLPEIVLEALDRTPRWLKSDLRECFKKFRGDAGLFYMEYLAEMVVNAEARLVDEMAFTIARMSPDMWSSGLLFPDLVEVNAQGVYEADEHLNYVQIVEYGSMEEGNFWSTLEYNVKTEQGDTIQVELDPYYYYWWMLHPRISDEQPVFINPGTGRAEHPPSGVFWRDYLMNHADDEYPMLREMLAETEVVWSNLRCNGTPENGAVGIVNQWIRQSLTFDSGQERPIQPVRIYELHMGRCGEHQDLTAAASRAALIPCAASMNIANDHVWNEFFINRWVVWEPVGNNLDDSLRYEGRQIPGIFKYRGDGYVENVTSRYTVGTAQLVVNVTDENGDPVDGARIIIYSEGYYGGFIFTLFAWTDSDGRAEITVGDQRNIYLRVDSEIGRYPQDANAHVRVIENSVDGEDYGWTYQFEAALPALNLTEIEAPEIEDCRYHLEVNYVPLDEIVFGRVWQISSFFAKLYPARLDFFVCDEANYQAYLNGEQFEVFETAELISEDRWQGELPADETWYTVFSNDKRTACYEDVRVNAILWSGSGEWGISEGDEKNVKPGNFTLHQNYPNPFNAQTNIAFDLPIATSVKLEILDLSGRQVSTLTTNRLSAGTQNLVFNAGDLQSGVYLYRISSAEFTASSKFILLK